MPQYDSDNGLQFGSSTMNMIEGEYCVPTGIVPRIKDTQEKVVHFAWSPTDEQLGISTQTQLIVPYPETHQLNPRTNNMSEQQDVKTNHNHYFKSVKHLNEIDVYRVLDLFEVTDPCIQHAVKKLLVAGGRGAGKGFDKDIQEAIDSLKRLQVMRFEDVSDV